MGKKQNILNLRRLASAVVMLLALVWLTVSLPYVNEAQQKFNALCKATGQTQSVDDSNPLSNTTEEKNESGASLLSEYLHELPVIAHHFVTVPKFYKCHPSDLYLAYHPELVIPPPEA